jgi:hypothetical protein
MAVTRFLTKEIETLNWRYTNYSYGGKINTMTPIWSKFAFRALMFDEKQLSILNALRNAFN